MDREIPAVKTRPKHVPYLLNIVEHNPGNYQTMVKEIHEFISVRGRRKQPPLADNSVNMTLPTLRLLRLIQGEENNTRLSVKGEVILRGSKDEKEGIVDAKFRKAFAIHLLELERRYYIPVLDIAQELAKREQNGSAFHLNALLERVRVTYGEEKASRDRIKKWLSYLKFAGFVRKTLDNDSYQIQEHQIRAATKPRVEISEDEFRQQMIKEYEKLSSERNLPYVPIPDLRESVLRVFHGKLWDNDFDDMLRKIKKEDARYVINFAEPMNPKSDGLRLEKGYYYYYIIIRDKERE